MPASDRFVSLLDVGDPAPTFTLPNQARGDVPLAGSDGQPVVVYFYPRVETPGCTVEACEYRDALAAVATLA